jgi:3-dehydroquinate synthase
VNHTIHFHDAKSSPDAEAIWAPWLEQGRIRILADERFKESPILEPLETFWEESPKFFIPAGEKSKTLESAQKIWSWLDGETTDKGHVLIVIGGGTITDLGGFVASTFKRGIPFILVPTTIVGMIDASIGGKNGINFSQFKNQIGVFQVPVFTHIDIRYCATLSPLEKTNGWMELVKHSLISKASFWKSIQEVNIHRDGAITPWIEQAAQVKLAIVKQDFHDQSSRKTLNYGHTIAHALEWKAQEDRISITHGVAVGLGMIWANAWSGSMHPGEAHSLSIVSHHIQMWLEEISDQSPLNWARTLNPDDLWVAILRDKKNQKGVVLDVALERIGRAIWDQPLSFNEFTSTWKQVFE